MTGAVRETVERVRDGQPVYAAPSESFVPFLYPPLYYWLAGGLAHFASTFVACKIVSLAATGVTAIALAACAWALGATRFWTLMTVLLYLGSYSLTLLFYDLERVDQLETAFVTLGLALLLGGKET